MENASQDPHQASRLHATAGLGAGDAGAVGHVVAGPLPIRIMLIDWGLMAKKYRVVVEQHNVLHGHDLE